MRSKEPYDLNIAQLNKRSGRETDRLMVLLAPSIVCILLCLICLCGVSLAWFTTTNTNAVSVVRTADYGVEITVKNGEAAVLPSAEGYVLDKGVEYTIELKATGGASTGFCKIDYVLTGDTTGTVKEVYTAQIAKGATLSFKMKLASGGVVTFFPQWGTCSASNRVGGNVNLVDETVIATQAATKKGTSAQGDTSSAGNGDVAVTTGSGTTTTEPTPAGSTTTAPAVTTPEPPVTTAEPTTTTPEPTVTTAEPADMTAEQQEVSTTAGGETT